MRGADTSLHSSSQQWAVNLVNVHIHQFTPRGAVVDAAALKQFQEQWATYRKLIASNYLSHAEVGSILHNTLNEGHCASGRTARCMPDTAG
jgi:hypothetical protein